MPLKHIRTVKEYRNSSCHIPIMLFNINTLGSRQIRNFNPGITILHDNHMSKYDGVIEEGGELYNILFDCVNFYYPEFTQPVVI